MYKQKSCVLWATGFVLVFLSACSVSVIPESESAASVMSIKNTRYTNLESERADSVSGKRYLPNFSNTYTDKISSNVDTEINLNAQESPLASRAVGRENVYQEKSTSSCRDTIAYVAENNHITQESSVRIENTRDTIVPRAFDMGTAYKGHILDGVNSYRKSVLLMDSQLSVTAQNHAMNMAMQKKVWHECPGIESVAAEAYRDGFLEGTILTIHCSDLAEDKVKRIGVGAAQDENGSIYVCVYAKTY